MVLWSQESPIILDFLAFQISRHSFSQQLITWFTGLSCSKQYELGLNDKARKRNRGISWDGASNFRKGLIDKETFKELSENEICSVVSDSLRPHRLYSPWNSPGWNTGVGSLSLLQGDLPNLGIEPKSPALRADSFTSWATREAQEYWSG